MQQNQIQYIRHGLFCSLTLICFLMTSFAAAEDLGVGTVTRLQNAAEIKTAGAAKKLALGALVQKNVTIETGNDTRLEITFKDGTKLMVGENARIKIDEYFYKPEKGIGKVIIDVLGGAFRMITGKIGKQSQNHVLARTQNAYIGVRGTDFFAGQALNAYGVLLIKGVITVRNDAGGRLLNTAGTGVNVSGPNSLPSEAVPWGEKRVKAALAAVSFQ